MVPSLCSGTLEGSLASGDRAAGSLRRETWLDSERLGHWWGGGSEDRGHMNRGEKGWVGKDGAPWPP